VKSLSKLALAAAVYFSLSCFAQPVGEQVPTPSCMAKIGEAVGVSGSDWNNYVYFNNLGKDGSQVQEKLETLGIVWSPDSASWVHNKIADVQAQASPADIEAAKIEFCQAQYKSDRAAIARARELLGRKEGIIKQSSAFGVEESVDEAIAGFAGVQSNPYAEAALKDEAHIGFKQALTLRISVNIVKGKGPSADPVDQLRKLSPGDMKSVIKGANDKADEIKLANRRVLEQVARTKENFAKIAVNTKYFGQPAPTVASPGAASQGTSCAELKRRLAEVKESGICAGHHAPGNPACVELLQITKCPP
jgi:hypothetical protein